jgi:hypothetical protein
MKARSSMCSIFLCVAIGCFALKLDAGNVNYNFNQNDGGWTSDSGWTWSADPKNQKSWRLLAKNAGEDKANYLLSPCFVVTDKTVQFIINEGHRFNFGDPSKPDKPPGAGQLQYTTNPGNVSPLWLGIGLSGGGSWSSSNNDVAPTLDPGTISSPAPLVLSGYAFDGISKNYDKPNNNGVSSLANLPALTIGSELQFRFLGVVRDDDYCPDTKFPGPIWDINKVLIKGVEEHACPEPSGLALAAAGMLAGVSWLAASRKSTASCRDLLGERSSLALTRPSGPGLA